MTSADDWMQIKVLGVPISSWCQKINGSDTKIFCSYCQSILKLKVYSLLRHGKSKAHLIHVARVHYKLDDNLKNPLKINCMTSAVLYSAMNCSVSLSPLNFDILSQNVVERRQPFFPTVFSKSWKAQATSILQPPNYFIDVYICFFCSREFKSRKVLHTHQLLCVKHQSPKSPSVKQPSCITPIKNSIQFHYVKESKKNYLSSLGLIPKKRALGIERPRRNTECENIDLEEIIPHTPTIARSPKCLLSHLSRDGAENESTKAQSVCKTLSWSSQESKDDTGQTEVKSKITLTATRSLYNIDLTSPLGLLTRKHVKGDPSLHILSDVESHCQTSTQRKDLTTFKLRDRPLRYPVTFRCKQWVSYIHLYKFTQREKKEFMRQINTGLNKKSRILLKRMKPCKVKLIRLTKAEIKPWTASQKLLTVDLKPLTMEEIAFWTRCKAPSGSSSPAIFPSGLSFSSPNVGHVLGLRTRQNAAPLKNTRLSMSNCVSEEILAEMTTHRKAVYQSLLSDTSCSESESERENLLTEHSQPCTPIRRTLSASRNSSPHKLGFLPDITNLKVDLISSPQQDKTTRKHSSIGEVKLGSGPTGYKQFLHPSGRPSSCSGSSSATNPLLKSSSKRVYCQSGLSRVCVREANEGKQIMERLATPVKVNVNCMTTKSVEDHDKAVKNDKDISYSSRLNSLKYENGATALQKTVNEQRARSEGGVINKKVSSCIDNIPRDLTVRKKAECEQKSLKKRKLSCTDYDPSCLVQSYSPDKTYSRKVICVDPKTYSPLNENASLLPVIPLVILTRNWQAAYPGNIVESLEDQDKQCFRNVNSSKNPFHEKAVLDCKRAKRSLFKAHSETRKSMQRAVACKKVCDCLLTS